MVFSTIDLAVQLTTTSKGLHTTASESQLASRTEQSEYTFNSAETDSVMCVYNL